MGEGRYFGRVGNQNWRFFGTAKDKDGKPTRNLLCLASAIPITRYTKLKGIVTPTTRHGKSILKNASA